MIRLTHIQKVDEDQVAKDVHAYLKKRYRYYFEIKVMGDGNSKSPTLKLTSRDYEGENMTDAIKEAIKKKIAVQSEEVQNVLNYPFPCKCGNDTFYAYPEPQMLSDDFTISFHCVACHEPARGLTIRLNRKIQALDKKIEKIQSDAIKRRENNHTAYNQDPEEIKRVTEEAVMKASKS